MALTAGERAALKWLSAVTVLGAGANIYRNWRHSDAISPIADEALARQLVAVDSAQRAGRASKARPRARPRRAAEPRSSGATERPTLALVDVDVADSAALEKLPRIGPALAARIVSDRSAHGPFGTLDGLLRVRGIGPKLAKGLESLVTFSGTPRPLPVRH